MTRIDMEVEGAHELGKQLKSISPALRRKAYKKGLISASQVIQKEAKRLVRRKTGNLRQGIRYLVEVSKSKNKASLGVTEKAFYGSFIERGTSRHRAYPFLSRAASIRRRSAVSEYGQEVKRVLDEIERRG